MLTSRNENNFPFLIFLLKLSAFKLMFKSNERSEYSDIGLGDFLKNNERSEYCYISLGDFFSGKVYTSKACIIV